ncbi:hypothetical protein DHD08_17205 [Arenibacter sp. H213]|nr:hypothetical protein [Arenibacter sp. H213]
MEFSGSRKNRGAFIREPYISSMDPFVGDLTNNSHVPQKKLILSLIKCNKTTFVTSLSKILSTKTAKIYFLGR